MAKGSSKHARLRFKKWINSYPDVCSWLEKHGDLEQLLEENDGLVKIDNFLPTFVAEGILELLEGIDDSTWNMTAAGDDYAHNNIRHEFLSVKSGPPGLDEVFRIFTLLLPDNLFTFSAAKYCKQGHIVPHDDRAYTQVLMEDGSMQLCSRDIACIYYLTKDWTAADGGQLVDLEAAGGPQSHVPTFNSVVAFRIPRWHEVKPVTGNRPRYSIFGWFLEPGKLYELNTGDEGPEQWQQQQQQQQQEIKEGQDREEKQHLDIEEEKWQQGDHHLQQPQQEPAKKKKSKQRKLLQKAGEQLQQSQKRAREVLPTREEESEKQQLQGQQQHGPRHSMPGVSHGGLHSVKRKRLKHKPLQDGGRAMAAVAAGPKQGARPQKAKKHKHVKP